MGDVPILDPGREAEMSRVNAELALRTAQREQEGDLVPAVTKAMQSYGDAMVTGLGAIMQTTGKLTVAAVIETGDAMVTGLKDLGRGVSRVASGVVSLERRLESGLERTVDMITDPVKRGLEGIRKDLTAGLDWTELMAFAGGVIYELGDEITGGLKFLWDNLGTALPELGSMIVDGLGKAYDFIKNEIVPPIIEGVQAIGSKIWELSPDWFKEMAGEFGDIARTIVDVSMKVGEFVSGFGFVVSRGLSAVFRTFGLDRLAGIFDSLSSTLRGIRAWFGGDEDEAAQGSEGATMMQAEAGKGRAIGAITQAGGFGEEAFAAATGIGATFAHAAHMSTLMDVNRDAGLAAIMAMRGAREAGAGEEKAYQLALTAFKEAREGRAAVAPAAPAVVEGGGMAAAVTQRAAEAKVAESMRETSEAVKSMANLQGKLLDRGPTRTTDITDTMRNVEDVDDQGLKVFGAGMGGGGQQ